MIETGILFGDVHSFYDLNLILSAVEIAPAVPKTVYVDIPGADGALDMTEALGQVRYNDRTHKFTFTMNPADDLSEAAWEAKKTEVSNRLNGMACRITLDKDPDYYWQGRCTVDSYKSNKRLRQFVIGARVRPYKCKQEETVVSVSLCPSSISWDGDATGIEHLTGIDNTYYHMSSYVPPVEIFENGGRYSWTMVKTGEKKTVEFSSVTLDPSGDGYYQSGLNVYAGFAVATKDNASIHDVVLPKKGIYFLGQPNISYVDLLEFDNPIIEAQTINMVNGRRSVCPIITCTDDNTAVVFNGNTFTFSAGSHKDMNIQFTEGINKVIVSGTGRVTFTYQEGDL